MSQALLDAEIKRLVSRVSVYGPETVWTQNEFSEILPFPKPLSLSFIRGLAGHNGATGMVCRELGLPYNTEVPVEDYLETLFGRLFVNNVAEKRLNSRSSKHSFMKTFSASVRLEKENRDFYRMFPDILTKLEDYYKKQSQADPRSLPDKAFERRIREINNRLNEHYCFVVKAGILANMNLRNIDSLAGKDNTADLISINSEVLIKNSKDAEYILDYRKKELPGFWMFGASVEYELACPRYSETGMPAVPLSFSKTERSKTLPRSKKIQDSVLSFKLYESLKVIYKTLLLREIFLLRMALLEAGRRSSVEDIFYLTLDEIPLIWEKESKKMIAERKEKEATFQDIDLPVVITPSDLDNLFCGTRKQEPHSLKGISVTGFEFQGKALICRDENDIEKADWNTIIISRYASPNLVTAFSKAIGIITETGGLLSHLAIVAREQGFPLILQAKDSTLLIKDGSIVTVDQNGNIFFKE